MRERAQALIDDVLQPLVAVDGGSIELLEVSERRVIVRLSGTCLGCPGQPYTLGHVIEPAFKKALGADIQVEARFGKSAS
jgi:Fe-S cluster biogenesis protein NfuA